MQSFEIIASIASLLSGLVAAIGVFLIYKQIREAKIAASMSSILQLHEKWQLLTKDLDYAPFKKMARHGCESLSEKNGQRSQIRKTLEDLAEFSEMMGVLVKARALDLRIVDELFGLVVQLTWRLSIPWVQQARTEWGSETIFENYEWFATRFEELKPLKP